MAEKIHIESFWRSLNKYKEEYKENIYVGYRYFDTYGVEPMYPFGYGLSYTDFEIKTSGANINETTVTLFVDVKNKGKVPGKEVIQVYLSAPSGRLKKEAKSLVAFKKTGVIAPGEVEHFDILFDLRKLRGTWCTLYP